MSDDKAKTVMIWSTRAHGYRQGGVRYGKAPVSIRIVQDAPEGDAPERRPEGLERRLKGVLTEAELSVIVAGIAASKKADREPALQIMDGTTEHAELDRELAEKRATIAAAARNLSEVKAQISAAKGEHQAALELGAEASADGAKIEDQKASAMRALQAAEKDLGTIEAQAAEIDALKAKLRVATAK